MTTLELKSILYQKIAEIDDKSFLSAINTMIETKSNTTIFKTTPEQKKKIEQGINDIKEGRFFTDEEVQKEVDKWLKEK
jgi:predicted transcriptional regulator